MRIALHVIGMLVLGVAFFALFAGCTWRIREQAAASGRSSAAGASEAQAPLGSLAAGIEDSLRRARDGLQRTAAPR